MPARDRAPRPCLRPGWRSCGPPAGRFMRQQCSPPRRRWLIPETNSAIAAPVDNRPMGDQPGRGPLAVLLDDVAAGRFPPANGEVTFVPPPAPRDAGVIGFTAHA